MDSKHLAGNRSRRGLAAALAVLGLVALLPVSARADAQSSPGKYAAAAAVTGVDLSAHPQPSADIQLLKGKRKHLLVIHGMIMAYVKSGPGMVIARVKVNGIPVEPFDLNDSAVAEDSCAGFCTVSGTWWLDLDAAELANPGAFVNKPLDVKLIAYQLGGTSPGTKMSLTATMVKK